MTAADDLYPPGPTNVPPDLTAPSQSYKSRVVIVLVSLILLVALYIGLVVGSAYFCYWSFSQLGSDNRPVRNIRGTYYREKDNRAWWIVPGICSGLLCLFLV